MRKITILIAAGALAALMLVPASSAQANCKRHSAADASFACVRDGYTWIDVCDHDADGHYAYARVWPFEVPDYSTTGYDLNGVQPGCQSENVTTHGGFRIHQFAVCVQYEGCTEWVVAQP